MTSPLSLQGLSLDSLPSSASDPLYQPLLTSLLDSAHSLVASLEQPSTWRPRKTYNTSGASTSTSSCSSPPGPAPLPPGLNWHQRASVHSSASFDQFKEGLLKDHSKHEQEYVESCVKAERVSVIKEGVLEVWRTAYHLPFPTRNRDFTFLLLTLELPTSLSKFSPSQLPDSPPLTPESSPSTTTSPLPATTEAGGAPRSFVVISVPVECEPRPGWLRAKYVSVESVVERVEGGVVWRMATASKVNGRIPNWVAEMAMPSKIAEDVPSFLEWLEQRERKKSHGDVDAREDGKEAKGGERRGSAP